MKIHDISIPISAEMPTYPGDPRVSITPKLQIARGDNANVSLLSMGDHTGTHLDPPVHFIPGGKTVDQLDLALLYGPTRVLDMRHVVGEITSQNLEAARIPKDIVRVLFKTGNSRLWQEHRGFDENYVGVSWDAARWLVDHAILLVGVDYLSIESFNAAEPNTHRTLLGAGVIIVEGLNLNDIAPGDYTLACFPLKIQNGDGGPLRAVLIEP